MSHTRITVVILAALSSAGAIADDGNVAAPKGTFGNFEVAACNRLVIQGWSDPDISRSPPDYDCAAGYILFRTRTQWGTGLLASIRAPAVDEYDDWRLDWSALSQIYRDASWTYSLHEDQCREYGIESPGLIKARQAKTAAREAFAAHVARNPFAAGFEAASGKQVSNTHSRMQTIEDRVLQLKAQQK